MTNIATNSVGLASRNAVTQPGNMTKATPSQLVTGKADVGAVYIEGPLSKQPRTVIPTLVAIWF